MFQYFTLSILLIQDIDLLFISVDDVLFIHLLKHIDKTYLSVHEMLKFLNNAFNFSRTVLFSHMYAQQFEGNSLLMKFLLFIIFHVFSNLNVTQVM